MGLPRVPGRAVRCLLPHEAVVEAQGELLRASFTWRAKCRAPACESMDKNELVDETVAPAIEMVGAELRLSCYRAEDLPGLDDLAATVMGKGSGCGPFSAKTAVRTGTTAPEWNETVVVPTMLPNCPSTDPPAPTLAGWRVGSRRRVPGRPRSDQIDSPGLARPGKRRVQKAKAIGEPFGAERESWSDAG